MTFDPFELDIDVTPANIRKELKVRLKLFSAFERMFTRLLNSVISFTYQYYSKKLFPKVLLQKKKLLVNLSDRECKM